jgi:hypothetical protein
LLLRAFDSAGAIRPRTVRGAIRCAELLGARPLRVTRAPRRRPRESRRSDLPPSHLAALPRNRARFVRQFPTLNA